MQLKPLLKQTQQRVMTITHKAFLRSLAPLERHYLVSIDSVQTNISISNDRLEVLISLAPEYIRKIANLRLTTTEVDFHVTGSSEAEIEAFWKRFELSFRRGGG